MRLSDEKRHKELMELLGLNELLERKSKWCAVVWPCAKEGRGTCVKEELSVSNRGLKKEKSSKIDVDETGTGGE